MLDGIVASVRARLAPVVAAIDDLRDAALATPAPRDFEAALRVPGLSVIAEIKRRSPSRGVIDAGLIPAQRAAAYQKGGAAAVSVLTEPDHFSGSLTDLAAVRKAVGVPVLRKDFLLHPAQVWESRASGADAVLLIVAILDDRRLADLLATAERAGLAALVEVHDEAEAERARNAGARIIGVNNRDLATFTVDPATAERVRPLLEGGVVAVAESGVSDPAGAARMADAGYDAILVGEAAVRSGDPAGFVASLREGR
ncbi:MAG: indole-3-glycerol phosphate synthase TrpC [Actinobacteria bacterium]|nr:indole-3-glycerol phosphate synthase TrpC [Actinomycetota bacterium]MBU1494431.1 indole-3-glycerol phosphate synthase TrpC [Actinomycetota bacterium]